MDAGEGNGDNVSLKRQRTPLSDSEDNVLSPGVCAPFSQQPTSVCSYYICLCFLIDLIIYFLLSTKGTMVRSGDGWNQLVRRITVQNHLPLDA